MSELKHRPPQESTATAKTGPQRFRDLRGIENCRSRRKRCCRCPALKRIDYREFFRSAEAPLPMLKQEAPTWGHPLPKLHLTQRRNMLRPRTVDADS